MFKNIVVFGEYGIPKSPAQLSISKDGKLLVTKHYKSVRIWQLPELHLQGILIGSYSLCSISPDGEYIAAVRDNCAEIWNISERKQVYVIDLSKPITSIAFSHDGKNLAMGCLDGNVSLWDIDSRTQIASLNHSDSICHVTFSEKRSYIIVSCKDCYYYIWNSQTYKLLKKIESQETAELISLSKTPDRPQKSCEIGIVGVADYLFVIGEWNIVRINISSGNRKVFGNHRGKINCFHAGKYLVTGSNSMDIKVWNLKDLALVSSYLHYDDFSNLHSLVLVPKTDVILFWRSDGFYKLDKKKETKFSLDTVCVTAYSLSPCGRYLLFSTSEGIIYLWDTENCETIWTYQISSSYSSMGFSPSGELFALWNGHEVEVREINNLSVIASKKPSKLANLITEIAFSPDEKYIAYTSLYGIEIWKWNENRYDSLFFTSGDRNIFGSFIVEDSELMWESDGELKGTDIFLDPIYHTLTFLGFAPKSKYIAFTIDKSVFDKRVYIADLVRKKIFRKQIDHDKFVKSYGDSSLQVHELDDVLIVNLSSEVCPTDPKAELIFRKSVY